MTCDVLFYVFFFFFKARYKLGVYVCMARLV